MVRDNARESPFVRKKNAFYQFYGAIARETSLANVCLPSVFCERGRPLSQKLFLQRKTTLLLP